MSPYTFGPDSTELPLGRCNVEIIEAKDGGLSRNGNPQLILELQDDAGRVLSDWLTMTTRAKWRAQQVWSAAGVEWPTSDQVNERDLIGRRVSVEVYEETWEGVTRRKVREYDRDGTGRSDIPSDIPASAPAPADDEPIPF